MTSTLETPRMTLERLARFGDAWAAGDLDTLMGFMTDDCVYVASVGPEPGATYRGRAEVRQGFAAMLAFDRDRERHSGPTFILGDVGVAQWSFVEESPDGRRTTIRGCDIYEFAGDKIRKKDAYRKVLDTPHGHVEEARQHFENKLAHETDPADVWKAIENGTADFLLVDCRPLGAYNKTHLPGAVNLPWSEITEDRARDLPDLPLVTYCWGPSCNAATKGTHRLAALGRPVKEMIGGLEYWIREGHPTEGRRAVQRGNEQPSDWGLVC